MRMRNVCDFLVKSPSLFGSHASLTLCVLLDNIRILILSVSDEIRLMIGCRQGLEVFCLEEA